ncbi:hypothetical protein ACHAXR_013098 [Thalassiosira sp. AJA248-18]
MAETASPAAANAGGFDLSLLRTSLIVILLAVFIVQCQTILATAYTIRLHAIENYGYIIHEFDPYFNFRAAQYLYDNGWKAFVNWFDYKVWYPLGRPVGTTIYPGMQVTAVWLVKSWLPVWFGFKEWIGTSIPENVVAKSAWEVSKSLSSSGGSSVLSTVASIMGSMGMRWNEMSLNDVCCLLPAWFGALATFITGMLALECSANFGYNEGSNFGTVLDQLPLFGYYIQRLSRPIRDTLACHSGMDMGVGLPPSARSSMQTASLVSMVATMFFMSIVPAHIMRSVGGGYDNECVAMAAMTLVFYLWTRSLRGSSSTDGGDTKQDVGFTLSSQTLTAAFYGTLTGLAYFYMVAAWGGYVFVVNLVGAHAASLILLGRHSSKLHAAYSAFYLVGTALATRVPVVGMTPLRSLEQLGPMLVFLGMQLVEYCERVRTRDNLNRKDVWLLRFRLFGLAGAVGVGIVLMLWPTGFFGPISSRVRGLFVKHTKTGNPLVDSVAEHQAAKPGTYDQYLNIVAKFAPVGFGMVAVGYSNDASSFLLVYGVAAYFFSHKMVRLILLTAPIACVLGGMSIGRVASWCVEGVCGWNLDAWEIIGLVEDDKDPGVVEAKVVDPETSNGESKKGKKKRTEDSKKSDKEDSTPVTVKPSTRSSLSAQVVARVAWLVLSYYFYDMSQPLIKDFQENCQQMAVAMSHPTILTKAQTQDGRVVTVDDYREAYWWLRDNTPEDSRIMAWWDYGYQITAIANRTTIADGNTWNHEHIALLGRALTSPMTEGHRIARHLADYVLLWTGGGGDDLAKSPHLARIANSVYRSMCPGDPTCSKFSMPGGQPSPMMAKSLLFRLHSNGLIPGVEVDRNRFKEVYKTTHGKVRIYKVLSVSKESKEWVLNNRVCDAPGSWFCPGHYPPGLEKVLKEKKDFKQLEDFNSKTEADDEYQKKYFEHLSDPEKARRRSQVKERREREAGGESVMDLDAPRAPLAKEAIRDANQHWEDNAITSQMFELIKMNDVDSLGMVLENQPIYAHVRSRDGRGPMWWAHEHGRKNIVKLLKSHGVSEKVRDKDGMTPLDLMDDEF